MNHFNFDIELMVSDLISREPYLLQRLNENYALNESAATKGLSECVRYLSLVAHSNQRLTPSINVDNIWHEFILFTRLYFSFCDKYLGRYIHHSPGGSDDENERQFNKTISLYKFHFGEPDPEFWGNQSASCANTKCGTCEGHTQREK